VAEVIGIIPSRYASTRFPGKPLVEIMGMSMIQRVYHQALLAQRLSRVVVATDDERIFEHVRNFGGDVLMTSPHHASGTDRCAEAVDLLGAGHDVVVNIQGDEPFLDPKQIDALVTMFDRPDVSIGTVVKRIESAEDLISDTVIKVVRDLDGKALYFSRTAIPHMREASPSERLLSSVYLKHIGIYAYRLATLRVLSALPVSALERAEGLEQLRWMENGQTIHLSETTHESNSVDTPDDLSRMLTELANVRQ
jgi:3-deoxy-manno-octulosonate cytidylyltransferase (CMP-KDO synthetase)